MACGCSLSGRRVRRVRRRAKPCKFGVNKRTGRCLKHKRARRRRRRG